AGRIQAMLDIRAPGAGVLAPDGRRMFFGWSVTGTPQVWRLDGPGTFPVQMTGGDDPTHVAAVTPDGRHLVLSRDRAGEENPGLYLQAAGGGPLREVFRREGVRAFPSFVSDDGRHLWFMANDVRPDAYVVHRFDIAAGSDDIVYVRRGLWFVADHRPDGRLLLGRMTGSMSREYSELDPGTGALTPLLGQGEAEDHAAVYGAAEGELLVQTPKLGEFRRLYRYAPGVGDLVPVSPAVAHDVSSFSIDEPRERILYTLNESGYTRLRALDARTFAELPLPPAVPGGDHVRFGSTTRGGRYTTIAVDTGTAPVSSFVLDWSDGTLTRWHTPSAPEIDTAGFAGAVLEYYPARDGTSIPMFVRRPAPAPGGPPPVVVHFHGGPESQSLPGFHVAAQLFVDAGFVWVDPNIRGSEGYGKSWSHADDGRRREDVIGDVEDCARFIREQWAVDGRRPRVGVYGGSYGGYAALMAMTRFAGSYDCGASVVGMSNLITFLENTAPYRRSLRTTEYGDPVADRDALVALSPITWVDRVCGPLLLIQGANDPRVPVGEAVQIHEALTVRGIESRLIVFPDEGHGMTKRANQVTALGHVLDFFGRHLGPAAADPSGVH
ncbi:MAG: prolyl oligopeptidase family serine peptidase, partial [Actinomycetota bacterium]